MSEHKHEYIQEKIELDEQAAHEAGECRGYPYCYECIAERDVEDLITLKVRQGGKNNGSTI